MNELDTDESPSSGITVKSALANYETADQGWKRIYEKAADDLKFISDDQYAQWDREDYEARVRTGRPALTIDQLGQFIHQVANDIRMNTPSIEVIPSDLEGSEAIAEVYKGLIREIEYRSNADDAYDTASLNAIRCSVGFMRVDFQYEEGETFNQELVIKRVFNPLSVFIDPASTECDGSDAKYGMILEEISVADFKHQYPGKQPVSFVNPDFNTDNLNDGSNIYIAEYYELDEQMQEIISPDGSSSREVVKTTVRRAVLSGKDVLEESTFPGKYIPIVPVYGEEAWVNGERQIYSLIRKSKSAQQMFNYWKSLETELLMKAPQAPVMAAEGQVDDYAEDWKNPSKAMVLRYKTTDLQGNPIAPPQRLEPPPIPIGVVNAARQTVDDIKATMGIYNSNLGAMSNEVSGVAIRQRQGEGDVATYHFQDNLNRSIAHMGRILVCAIPDVYSNERVIRIIGMEDDAKMLGINGALVPGQPATVDLKRGKYMVRVKTGGSFTTKRQEAAEFLTQLVTNYPQMMNIVGDLMFDNFDFAGSQVMADRMRKVIDPKLLDEGTDPQIAALTQALQQQEMAMQQMQQQLARAEQLLNDRSTEFQLRDKELQIKAADSQVKARDSMMDNEVGEAKLALEAIKERNDYVIDTQKIGLERAKLGINAAKQLAPKIQPFPAGSSQKGVF